ncbi:hypothetical protein BDV10DRAFT_198094 [Aspergillus recurvatus]
MASRTGLNILRQKTAVGCDTLDEEVTRTLGPFQDCTSNQAIAFAELSKPEHAGLIEASIEESSKLSPPIDIATVKLTLKIVPHIRGYVHVQTNPYYSYSTEKTVANAFSDSLTILGIVQIFRCLAPDIDTAWICIKIPIRTLATTLFTFVQAALAAEVGCTYNAPYVNQLKKLLPLCVSAQNYYGAIGVRTRVLPASLTSTDEIFALAGAHHITIAPGLLLQLSTPVSGPLPASLFDSGPPSPGPKAMVSYVNDEAEYRIAFSRSDNGSGGKKLVQAINIFCDMQNKLMRLFKGQQQAA